MEHAKVLERLQEQFGETILDHSEFRGDLSVRVKPEAIVEVARFLRDDPQLQYNFLENICGVDYLGRDPRFEVVYHFISLHSYDRICVKVGLPEANPSVPTLTTLWAGANWQERETYDMFGIIFEGHPSLVRILMPDDWEGHPQRKDVPLGYEEVAFTFNQEQIYAHKPFAKE
jgi:NADH-quinone oxidoreductase subunit C